MKMNKKITYILISILFFGFGFFARSFFLQYTTSSSASDLSNVDLSLFWETWNTLEDKYPFQEPNIEDKIYGAIMGLVNSYNDQHMVFFPPTRSKFFAENIAGEFGGVGMEVGIEDGSLVVVAPLKDSPAERSGILSGDIILAIDGENVSDMDFNTAISSIRGNVGTSLVLTIIHPGEEKEIDIIIVREIVQIPILNTETIDETFIIHFYSFSEQSNQEFTKALIEFRESGLENLLIDLRNNPGGFLSSAIDVTSHFLDEGLVVVKEDFGRGEDAIKKYRSLGYDTLDGIDYNLNVLINRGSASASEIFAGALQDHGQALVFGGTSFGKGSVQELLDLSQKTSLKVTVARWLTPNDIQISGTGIVPDVIFYEDELEQTLEILNNTEITE